MSKKGKIGESSRKENMKWTEELDNTFIDAMLEQQSRGFRVDGTFTTAAYKNMLTIIKKKLGVDLTKDNLKNRIKTLKSNFSTCHELFKNKSGFSWSSETKLFQADDCVWDELVQVNPNMRKWRTTPILNYDKLVELFSKDRATGNLASTCSDLLNLWKNRYEDDDIQGIDDVPTPSNFDDFCPIDVPTPLTTKAIVDESSSAKSGKRKRKEVIEDSDMKEIVKCMKEANQFMVQQTTDEVKWKKEKEECLECPTNKLIYEELKKIGVPPYQLVPAYVALGSDKEKAKLLFSVPEDVRLDVINELLKHM